MTLRFAYDLFPQKAWEEWADFTRWAGPIKPGQGDDFHRHNGAGEVLVFSAASAPAAEETRRHLARLWSGFVAFILGAAGGAAGVAVARFWSWCVPAALCLWLAWRLRATR